MIENQVLSLTLTVAQTVRQLSNAYVSLIKKERPLKRFPSVMLWGPPGVGKSQAIRQIADQIANKTGKQVNVTDVRLLLFNPVDLRGIPTSNADKTLAIWLKPQIFQMNPSEEVINILFLDEISAAPQSVQAAAYQITLDRTVGEHKLPDNCIVIAAGNRVTDRSVAFNMPKALANRLCHIEIATDSYSWHNWAVKAGINRLVLGYLSKNPSKLMQFDPQTDGQSFATPRSWEMVSNILNDVSENVVAVFPLIAGCIGEEAAYELRSWSEIYSHIPEISEIFDGYTDERPVMPEGLYAVAAGISTYARTHHSRDEIENALNYAANLPAEFKSMIFTDLLEISEIRKQLQLNWTFNDWFERSGRRWDDYE